MARAAEMLGKNKICYLQFLEPLSCTPLRPLITKLHQHSALI